MSKSKNRNEGAGRMTHKRHLYLLNEGDHRVKMMGR